MNAPGSPKEMTGLQVLEMAFSKGGSSPSIGRTLNFSVAHIEHGRVDFEGEPNENHLNPLKTVHGGYAATLLDSCMGCAVHSTLPAGKSYTTLELKINYIRAMRPGIGKVRAIGKVIHAGRSTATAEGKLVDAEGRLIAHGTTTCIIMDM
ncbi:MAG: PaaI family thioesterase [Minwuia sp.]|nr:PaaI family thioesterase [Minwuia sp.]